VTICHDCHATIRFVRLDTGRPIPIDPIPHERGNVAAREAGTTLVGYVISASKPLRPEYWTYLPHRATCRPGKPRVHAEDRTPTLFDN
jgi:hypothetical protein